MSYPFKVIAITQSRFAVTRHSISTSKGGEFVASESFTWPETPVWMAEEMMRERFPKCDVQANLSRVAIEFSQRDQ